MDQLYTIFPAYIDVKSPLLAIACNSLINNQVLIFSVGLYHSLFTHLLKKYL